MVTANDITKSFHAIGVNEGDTVIVHSSYKALGELENGADTIISGIFDAVGEKGTVVFPTLCQKDWPNVYKNWNLDVPSDVGYLTNYFRLLPGAKRSDQATHSVAAKGYMADYITKTHGVTGKRYGIFGDTPFAADSPWEKMYELNAKIVQLGVNVRKVTFRHYVEYVVMEKYLKMLEGHPQYEAIKDEIWTFEKNGKYVAHLHGKWPEVEPIFLEECLFKEGKVRYNVLNGALLTCIDSKDFVEKAIELMEAGERRIYSGGMEKLKWMENIKNLSQEMKTKSK